MTLLPVVHQQLGRLQGWPYIAVQPVHGSLHSSTWYMEMLPIAAQKSRLALLRHKLVCGYDFGEPAASRAGFRGLVRMLLLLFYIWCCLQQVLLRKAWQARLTDIARMMCMTGSQPLQRIQKALPAGQRHKLSTKSLQQHCHGGALCE